MNEQRLIELLARYPAPFQPRGPLQSLAGGGGLSGARLWRFRAGDFDLVLRSWPPHGPGRPHVDQVHRWLFMAADLSFIPVPLRDRQGESVQEWGETLWEVAPWMAGEADLARPPLADHLRVAFAGLAAFHQRLAAEEREGTSAGLRQRHDQVRQLVHGGFDSLEAAIHRRRQSEADPDLRPPALAWLALARRVAPQWVEPLERASACVIATQPTVRDARPEHFLFAGDRLSGMVDFGAMGIDSVAGDLARLLGEWLGDFPAERTEALHSYEQIRPLDPSERRFISTFEAGTALLVGERWVRWHFVENRTFDHQGVIASGLERGLKRLNGLARMQDHFL